MQFDREFLSPYFINDAERQMSVLEDAAVLLCEIKLSSLNELLPLLEQIVTAGRPLLVIAEDVDNDTLVINNLRATIKTCAIKSPGFGDRRKAMLQDIATLTGANVVSEELGLPLSKVQLSDLGSLKRAEIGNDECTLIGGGGSPGAIAERIAGLHQQRDAATNDYDKEKLDDRIAKLSGGVGVIKIGAATETELKERKVRVEDALHATRAAVAEGIVPGGGVALLRARGALEQLKGHNLDEDSGIHIVARALEAPLRQIVSNAGIEPSIVMRQILDASEPDYGFNAATRAYGGLLKMGVVDPAKVTRLALQNAGSIASLILTIDCLIASAPSPSAGPGLDQLPHATYQPAFL